MRRRDFPVGPLKGKIRQKKILAFDVETCAVQKPSLEENHFLVACVYDGRRWYTFNDGGILRDFFFRRKWRGWVAWSHSLEFDLNTFTAERKDYPLFRNFFGSMLKSAVLILRDRTREIDEGNGIVRRTRCREKLYFCDSLHHWKGTLKKYGRLLGLQKLNDPRRWIVEAQYPDTDVKMWRCPRCRERWAREKAPVSCTCGFNQAEAMASRIPTARLMAYCRRDTRILYRLVTRMQKLYVAAGCELKSSISASALDLFRRSYMHEEHSFRPVSKNLGDFFLQGYAGGRTEDFFHGVLRDVNICDVNKMYVSCMAEMRVPVIEKWDQGWKIPDDRDGVAEVDVHVPDMMYPVLWYRPYEGSLLFFPVGRWRGMFTLRELRYAVERGAKIEKVYKVISFRESAPVFQDYAQDVYRKNVEAQTDIERMMYKDFGNHLYGKWAQKGEAFCVGPSENPEWEEKIGRPPDVEGRTYEDYFGWIAERRRARLARFANGIWGAEITAEARIRLHRHLVRLEGLYCDTDSVFTKHDVPETKELGALSLKYHTPQLDIRGPKAYADCKGVKLKGIWGQTELKDYYWLTRALRFREAATRGLRPNSFVTFSKGIVEGPTKRCFARDGTSRPWTVEEIRNLPQCSARIARRPTLRLVNDPSVFYEAVG